MSRVVVNLVELNRRRHVELESITAALSEAVAVGTGTGAYEDAVHDSLDAVRELVRALRGLLVRPLPEALMAGTAEVAVELAAPVHELEALAEELDRVRGILEDEPAADAGNLRATDELESLAERLRVRALTRT